MIKFLISVCAVVALAYSPLTLADQITSIAKSNEEIQKYMAFEGNTTLQKLVSATYGVTIQELLNFFSQKDDTDVIGLDYYSTTPEWLPKLIVHLVNEEIQQSNKTLKLTQKPFPDDGTCWYLELSVEIESMSFNDQVRCTVVDGPGAFATYHELGERADNITFRILRPLLAIFNNSSVYCLGEFYTNGTKDVVYSKPIQIVFQTVVEEPDNIHGPFVWPSAPVIMYHKPILVKLVCWAWLELNNTLTWYLIQGNNKEKIATATLNDSLNYLKLEFSKMFDVSDNGSVIMCDATVKPSQMKIYSPPQNFTLLYYEPIEDECKHFAMLGWGMLALLALSAGLSLAALTLYS